MRPSRHAFAAAVLVCSAVAAQGQPVCPPQPARWAEGFNPPGLIPGSALWTADVVDDDGPEGPRASTLYLGGNFTEIGGRTVRSMARWNPDLPDGFGGRGGWEPFPVPLDTSGTFKKFIAFDLDGPAGPNPTRFIALGSFSLGQIINAAYFNGSSWQPMPGLNNAFVEDAVIYDPDAGGPAEPELFIATASGVLRWSSAGFAPTLGASATNLTGDGFAIFDTDGAGSEPPSLFFANSAGLHRWNGTRFNLFTPTPGPTVPIGAILTADPDGTGPYPVSLIVVYASGQVRILQPGASTWTTLPTMTAPLINATALTTFDPDGDGPLNACLVVSGTPAGGSVPIARYFDGAAWSSLGPSNIFYSHSRALAVFDFDGDGPRPPALFCGGSNVLTLGQTHAGNAAVWDVALDPPAWRASIPGDALNAGNSIRGALVDEDGAGPSPRRLFLAGVLSGAGPIAGRQIARLDSPSTSSTPPTAWAFVNPDITTLNNPVGAAAFDFDGPGPEGESLVIIRFWNLGTPNLVDPVNFVGRLAPPISAEQPWQFHGSFRFAATSPEGALGALDDDGSGPNPAQLYVAGPFTEADGVPVGGLARWVVGADAWQAPPVPYTGESITTMAPFDDDGDGPNPPRLHVVARISATSWTVYRMDDDQWTRLGDPLVTAGINAIRGFDDDGDGPNPPRLYIGGEPVGSLTPSPTRVMFWTGAAWQSAGTLGGAVGGQAVRSLVEFDDDGPGPNPPALFAAGAMTSINGVAIPGGLVKLVGSAWQPVAGVSGSGGQAFVIDPDGSGPRPASLFYTGRVVAPSGVLSTGAGLWSVPPVGADFNGDWSVTIQDLFDFLDGYFTGDPRADIDASGSVAVGDIFAYLGRYFGGC